MGREDELWERAVWYDWFCQRYGWTVDQVDEQPAWFLGRAPEAAAIRAEVAGEAREST